MTRPGVYVSEAPLPRVVQTPAPTSSFGAFVGTALRGPTEPTYVESWSQFNSLFGGFGNNTTLPYAMHQFFASNGSPAYVARVIDGAGGNEATNLWSPSGNDLLDFTAKTKGAWGNAISYRIENVVTVYSDPPTNSVIDIAKSTFDVVITEIVRGARVVKERFQRLSVDAQQPRYVEKIINSTSIGSAMVTVVDADGGTGANFADYVATGYIDLTGGADGNEPVAADYVSTFEQFESLDALLVVNAPGLTDVSGLQSLIDTRGDSFLVVDTEPLVDALPDESNLPNSSYAGVYFPWIYITDPAPDAPRGSTVLVPPGASVVGRILANDRSPGPWKAPAGVGASLGGAVAVGQRLTHSELDTLAEMNINAIRPVVGSGITIMGARSRSTDIAKYISVRRTLNYIKKRAAIASQFALFEPNTPLLWEQLRSIHGAFLSELWRSGALVGDTSQEAFYVKVDRDNNTPQTIANGEVHVEIGVAPVFPAEFVIIRVGTFESEATVFSSEEF